MRGFEYAAPRSLDEAFQLLSKPNGLVKPLAGGTDLIAQMKDGRHQPALVLDLKAIPQLQRLETDALGLHIGAAVSCWDVGHHPAAQATYPAIAFAALLVGSIQIQTRASIGGNICNAAPSADTVPPLLVYAAQAHIAGPRGSRTLPLDDFFTGPGKTVLAPDEILQEVLVPPPPPRSTAHYLRFTPREEMDIAVAGVASLISLRPASRIVQHARIALAAVAPTPLRAPQAEAALEGKRLDESRIQDAAHKASLAARPITDVRGSAEYRRELVQVLTRRTLAQCQASLALS